MSKNSFIGISQGSGKQKIGFRFLDFLCIFIICGDFVSISCFFKLSNQTKIYATWDLNSQKNAIPTRPKGNEKQIMQ